MTMAFIRRELLATGDPVDAERANMIGAILESRGQDIPLPETGTMQPELTVASQAGLPEGVAPTALTVPQADAAELLRLSGVQCDATVTSLHDGLAAYARTGHELGIHHKPQVHAEEELAALWSKERNRDERDTFGFIAATVDQLIPPQQLRHDTKAKTFQGIAVPDLETFKRLQTVVFFPLQSPYYMPHIVIGQKPSSDRFTQLLGYDLVHRVGIVYEAHKGDLEAFMRLPAQDDAPKLTQKQLESIVQSDSSLVLNCNSPHTVHNTYVDDFFNRHMRKATDLQKHGLRLRDCLTTVRPDILKATSDSRLPQAVIEEFDVIKHLAHVQNALSA